MKRKFLITTVALLMTAFTMPAPVDAESISYTATYDHNKLSIRTFKIDGSTYSSVQYAELFSNYLPGYPVLPVDYLKFSVPYNAVNFTITTSDIIYSTFQLPYMIYPSSFPAKSLDSKEHPIVSPDSSAYFSGNYYPVDIDMARITNDDYLFGENHIVTVAIMPLAYRYHTECEPINELRMIKSVKLTLSYDIDDSLSSCPFICRVDKKRKEGYNKTQAMVVNSNDVCKNAPRKSSSYEVSRGDIGVTPLPQFLIDSLEMSPIDYLSFDYLIIVPDSIKTNLKRLKGLKNQKGYNVGIYSIDELLNNPLIDKEKLCQYELIDSVNDKAGIIRVYLTYAYLYGNAQYVFLAGKDVPYKYGWYESTPTDRCYLDLSPNWEVSIYRTGPELYVGRILARTGQEINNYTDKLFRYELNPGKGDYSYLKRAIYTNGYDQYIDESRTISFTDIIRMRADSIFPNVTTMNELRDNNNPYPTGRDIINEINNTQYGFISFNNHGSPLGIVTHGKGGPSPHKYRWLWAKEGVIPNDSITYHVHDDTTSCNGLNNLTNKYYPSICFSTACSVMPFDIMEGYDTNCINFGESFTLGKDYGGPAFLGNTRKNGFEAARLGMGFAKMLKMGISKIGQAHALSRSWSYDGWSCLIHNLLGDPEFEVWTDTPIVFSNVDTNRSNNSITITGITADSTIIAYYSNDGQIGTDTVSASNLTINGISPNSTVMLYRHNYIPYIVPMALQNTTLSNSQYVIASDVTAGNAIDSNRTSGDVIVPAGIEYEIEASGKVTLEDGFKVEKGATFAVYPSCF